MELPPRVKTLYPNANNIVNDVDTPIPIESAFFLEDAKKDSTKSNRYYFDFPGNWITSNKGETIIGIRNIWMIKPKRRLDFILRLFKIKRTSYEKYFKDNPNNNINDLYKYANLDKKLKEGSEFNYKELGVVCDLLPNDDLSDFHNVVCDKFKYTLKNEWENSLLGKNTIYDEHDIEVYQYYDKYGYHIRIDSPYYNKGYIPEYFFYFQLFDCNDDFKEVFNIGSSSSKNKYIIYKNRFVHDFRKSLTFDDLWDRGPCKIYSSIAEQSLHQYIGNSDVYYTPIKYYKLGSTDQKFWIEFYSATHYNIPITLPLNESFCIEMQFLPFNKML